MRQDLPESVPFTGKNTFQVNIDDSEVLSFTDSDMRSGRYIQFSTDVTEYLNDTHIFSIQGSFEAQGGALYLDNVSLLVNTENKIFLPLITVK